jgi:hypothetical protein
MVLRKCKSLNLIADAASYNRLQRTLERIGGGNDEDYRSLIFRRVNSHGDAVPIPRPEIVAEFDSKFEGVRLDNSHHQQVLTDFEMGQRASIGPQSEHLNWSRDKDDQKVTAVYSDKPMSPLLKKDAYDRALDHTQSLLSSNSVSMSSFQEAIHGAGGEKSNPYQIDAEGMDGTTNSGLPYDLHRWVPTPSMDKATREEVGRAYQFILEKAQSALEGYNRGELAEWWAITFMRLVQKGYDITNPKKVRIVMGLDKAEPVLWKLFSFNLMQALRQYDTFCAWKDLPCIDIVCQKYLKQAKAAGRVVLSGDLSSFDATIPPWFIKDMGPVIGSWIKGGEKLAIGLCESLAYNTLLVSPTKVYLPQPSSMKSGSGGTNLLDSLINLTVHYYAEEIGLYKVESISVQGDDFIIDGPGVEPGAVEEAFSHFGMVANSSKQMFEPDALSYLQRIHLLGEEGGITSVYRTLGSMLSYERLRYSSKDWNAYSEVARIIGQLENCVFSPWYETIVEFASVHDKYHLGADLPASEVLKRAGEAGAETLLRGANTAWKAVIMDTGGFAKLPTNGVLRGGEIPAFGSHERFLWAYGDRINKCS